MMIRFKDWLRLDIDLLSWREKHMLTGLMLDFVQRGKSVHFVQVCQGGAVRETVRGAGHRGLRGQIRPVGSGELGRGGEIATTGGRHPGRGGEVGGHRGGGQICL